MIKSKNMAMNDTGRVFNKKITIQRKKEQDGPIVPLDPWEDYISLWADEKFNRTKSFYSDSAPNLEYDKEFIVRFRKDLDNTMRIIQGDDIYEIESIIPLDRENLNLVIRAIRLERNI